MADELQLTPDLVDAIARHAQECFPRECCGLVARQAGGTLVYMPGDNAYTGTAGEDRFELRPELWAAIEDAGHQVVAVVHSHPNESANPSIADRVGCEQTGLPWVIMGWPSQVVCIARPCGFLAPYKGRTFHHGVVDCYTLIRDWYARELGIELPDFVRHDDWWLDAQGSDLYMGHFGEAGFVAVEGEPRRHDVVLMQVKSDRANHAAIYLGNGVVLHHLAGRLSCEDVYGGYWVRHTVQLVRHHTLLKGAPA